MSNAGFLFLSTVTFSKTVLCFSLFFNWSDLRLYITLAWGVGASCGIQDREAQAFTLELKAPSRGTTWFSRVMLSGENYPFLLKLKA